MAKEIHLTQGKVSVVDDDIFERINKYKWRADKIGNTFYAIRYISIKNKNTTIGMHREVLSVNSNELIDHIDGNGLNNQKSNLRICSKSENAMNRYKQKNNTSGYKGVFLDKKSWKWVAQIASNGKKIHLGYFYCIIKAAKAYNDAAIKYHGEFAKLNSV